MPPFLFVIKFFQSVRCIPEHMHVLGAKSHCEAHKAKSRDTGPYNVEGLIWYECTFDVLPEHWWAIMTPWLAIY